MTSPDHFTKWGWMLDQHFSFFKTPVTTEAIRQTLREATQSVRITIKNNQIAAVAKSGPDAWVWRARGNIGLIQDTLQNFTVPDVDFLISQCDHPISGHRQPYTEIPVFSFCKTADEQCILLPFTRFARDDVPIDPRSMNRWDHWTAWHRWDQAIDTIDTINARFPWSEKQSRCFFGGHSYAWNNTRVKYCELLLDNPAYLTGHLSCIGDNSVHLKESRLKPLFGQWTPMTQYPQYKFLMHLDGNTCSERLRYLLAFNSVAIKPDSPWFEFYYPLLERGRHFIGVKDDLSDLVPTIEKLQNDDTNCQYVAREGQRFIKEVLTYQNVLWYVKEALTRYAQLQA